MKDTPLLLSKSVSLGSKVTSLSLPPVFGRDTQVVIVEPKLLKELKAAHTGSIIWNLLLLNDYSLALISLLDGNLQDCQK